MVKKLFALASVTALGGLVAVAGAGCSSESEETPPTVDGGGTDAKTDAKKAPTDDSGPDDEVEPPACYGADGFGIPPEYAYQGAGAKQVGSCTNDQVFTYYATLNAAAKAANAAQKPLDFEASVAPAIGDAGTCLGCIQGTATEWRVYNKGSLFYANSLGCLEMKEVFTKACAKALYDINICFSIACGDCSDSESDACIQYSIEHDCKPFNDATTADCKLEKNLGDLMEENGCGDSANVANSFCGTGEGVLETDGGI